MLSMSEVPYISLEEVRQDLEKEYKEKMELSAISTTEENNSLDIYKNSEDYSEVLTRNDLMELEALEVLEEMKENQEMIINHVNVLEKELEKANKKITELSRVTEKEVRNIMRHYRKRVSELISIYGVSARRKIQSNLQGYIYKKYGVNAYESLLMTHEPDVVEDILNWRPSEELEIELRRYKNNQQTFDM